MYLLTYFRADGTALANIDHDCRINEAVLRQLVLKVEPKLVEQLVAQAMAPHEPPPPEREGSDEEAAKESARGPRR
jgi:small subunit ribosomal protein S6